MQKLHSKGTNIFFAVILSTCLSHQAHAMGYACLKTALSPMAIKHIKQETIRLKNKATEIAKETSDYCASLTKDQQAKLTELTAHATHSEKIAIKANKATAQAAVSWMRTKTFAKIFRLHNSKFYDNRELEYEGIRFYNNIIQNRNYEAIHNLKDFHRNHPQLNKLVQDAQNTKINLVYNEMILGDIKQTHHALAIGIPVAAGLIYKTTQK